METMVPSRRGEVPVHVAVPSGSGPWPAVVVIHDALGMSSDLRRQAAWLADEGFVAAAPDLYHRGRGRLRCMVDTIRQATAGEGAVFDDLDAVQGWLRAREDCTGRVGVIGFCMGGGFAVLLAAGHGYDASSVNYGGPPDDADQRLAGACPIVASYGGRDRLMRAAPLELERALSLNGVDHDLKVYPDAGHGFMNRHDPDEVPVWALVMGAVSGTGYHEASAADARRRVATFFRAHL
jgi:carboxymethylenebutenolidase